MSRSAMRSLSARLRTLQAPPRLNYTSSPLGSIRAASRYSNPGVRSASSPPTQDASFTGSAASSNSTAGTVDQFAAKRDFDAHRANALRRMRYAGVGLLVSAAGLAITVYNLDLDDIEKAGKKNKNKIQLDASQKDNQDFQGRHVHVIGAGEDKRIIAEGKDETELVQTGSGSVPYFPRTISLPASPSSASDILPAGGNAASENAEEEYTLVGLGIRTVTFLGIEVYVMGMYVRTTDIAAIQSRLIHLVNPTASTLVPSEKEDLRQRLLDPTTSTEIWETLLREEGFRSVWRVVPSKNTDFAHLRDGWMNGIKRATNEVSAHITSGPALTDYTNDSFGGAVKNFKEMFVGGGKAPKGSVILLLREASGSMQILFQDSRKSENQLETIGKVQDPRIARLIWMGYLAGKGVSSEMARKAVVDGYVGFAARPLGSVEAMVR